MRPIQKHIPTKCVWQISCYNHLYGNSAFIHAARYYWLLYRYNDQHRVVIVKDSTSDSYWDNSICVFYKYIYIYKYENQSPGCGTEWKKNTAKNVRLNDLRSAISQAHSYYSTERCTHRTNMLCRNICHPAIKRQSWFVSVEKLTIVWCAAMVRRGFQTMSHMYGVFETDKNPIK